MVGLKSLTRAKAFFGTPTHGGDIAKYVYLNQVIQAVTFYIPDGRRSLNLWKSHLNHPKKVTKNHLEIVFNLCRRMLHRS